MEKAFNDQEDSWFTFHDSVFDKYWKDVEEGKAKLLGDMPKGTANLLENNNVSIIVKSTICLN